jgi:hypothetical protein
VTNEEKAAKVKNLHNMELDNLCACSNIIMSDAIENYG